MPFTPPHTFQDGEPLTEEVLNANPEAIAVFVNALEDAIEGQSTDIEDLESRVTNLEEGGGGGGGGGVEEGTYTPTLYIDGDPEDINITGELEGYYTKVGNFVTAKIVAGKNAGVIHPEFDDYEAKLGMSLPVPCAHPIGSNVGYATLYFDDGQGESYSVWSHFFRAIITGEDLVEFVGDEDWLAASLLQVLDDPEYIAEGAVTFTFTYEAAPEPEPEPEGE